MQTYTDADYEDAMAVLGRLQEEASEIIIEVSKIRRSGTAFIRYACRGETANNATRFKEEAAQLSEFIAKGLASIEILEKCDKDKALTAAANIKYANK